jgi:hypothetical protein
MFTAQGPTQDFSSLIPAVLMVITVMVIFWRAVIKLLAIVVILLVVLGFSELLHGLH